MEGSSADTGTSGIHHVTAITGDPQKNLDFYAELLSLRLVKLTVTFDDPAMYHLYYGDGTGKSGDGPPAAATSGATPADAG